MDKLTFSVCDTHLPSAGISSAKTTATMKTNISDMELPIGTECLASTGGLAFCLSWGGINVARISLSEKREQ